MKSAYEEKEFAQFWDDISGAKGQTYKEYVVDPAMFKLLESLKNKTVLDLGCGNGYLGPVFIKKGAKKVILVDISKENLEIAKRRNPNKKVSFIHQDATKRWKVPSGSVDVIFSDMMLNEIENIRAPFREAARILKKRGKFVFAVTHPAWDLFEYARKKFTGISPIIPEAKPYFERGYNHFVMSTDSLKPPPGREYQAAYNVEHFQRPLEDYFNAAVDAGFQIVKMAEPPLTKKVLKDFPGYQEMTEHPIGIIFLATKK